MLIKNRTCSSPSTPSFSAKLHFVNGAEFEDIKKSLPDIFEVGKASGLPEWSIEEGAVKKPTAFTEHACNCIVGSIFNTQTKLTNMFHLGPYEATMLRMGEVQDTIFRQAKELLGNSKEKLEGFLTGGNNPAKSYGFEKELYGGVKDTFDKISTDLGMTYSMVGQRSENTIAVNVISDANTNTHYIYAKQYDFPIDTFYNIIYMFDKRIISPQDSVAYRGVECTEYFHKFSLERIENELKAKNKATAPAKTKNKNKKSL